jgi:hypothetical protein
VQFLLLRTSNMLVVELSFLTFAGWTSTVYRSKEG